MTSALVDLTSQIGPGWESTLGAVGYYIHLGRVYLDAVLGNDLSGLTGTVLLTGLPAEARPPSPVPLTIPVDLAETDLLVDSTLVLPTSYTATLGTDGSLVLDAAVPAQLNTTPDVGTYFFVDWFLGAFPRYSRPLLTALILSNLSWEIASEDDSPTFAALTTGTDFTRTDADYVAHGSRVHFAGHATASIDSAVVVMDPPPSDAIAGLSGEGNAMPVLRGGDVFLASVTSTSVELLETPDLVKPLGQPGPLSRALPKIYPNGPGYHDPSPGVHPALANFTSILSGQSSSEGPPFSAGGDQQSGVLDYGYNTCPCTAPFPVPHISTVVCPYPGDAEGCVLRLGDVLSTISPQPDWFAIKVSYKLEVATRGPFGYNCGGVESGPCECLDPDPGLTFSLSVTGGPSTYAAVTVAGGGAVSVAPMPIDPELGDYDGMLLPDTPLYAGATGMSPSPSLSDPAQATDYVVTQRPELLWKWGQISGDITVTPHATLNSGEWDARLIVVPYWEIPVHAIREGDVLDLTGTGWVGAFTKLMSTIAAGVPTVGIRARQMILGTRAPG